MAIKRRPAPTYLRKESRKDVDAARDSGNFTIYKAEVAITVLTYIPSHL
jgi:hypothetical protein